MFYRKDKENNKTPQLSEVFNGDLNNSDNNIIKIIKQFMVNQKAFTLIELLVVIAIIGILSTLVIVSLGNSRASSRDAKRLNDLRAMANALELYYADNNSYPETENFSPGETFEAGGVVYMSKVPNNPTPYTDGSCPDQDYIYIQKSGGTDFLLLTCIGGSTQSFNQGAYKISSKHTGNYKNSMINTNSWLEGEGSVSGYATHGSSVHNVRSIDLDPWNNETVIWEGLSQDETIPSSGWNGGSFPIDNTKMYRFSVWVQRTVLGAGRFYLGLNGYGVGTSNIGILNLSNGANNTNPYFFNTSVSSSSILVGEWVLVVGHVHPAGTPTQSPPYHPESGLYKVSSGPVKFANIHLDFIWREDNLNSRHRTYLTTITDPATRQRWVYPRVDLVDGSEPSIEELVMGAPQW